ncbi:hypothetical protein IG631_19833 [Alternaria alternata]|nr:hypothetical protein IG631_19833 [Alternaria alternata]
MDQARVSRMYNESKRMWRSRKRPGRHVLSNHPKLRHRSLICNSKGWADECDATHLFRWWKRCMFDVGLAVVSGGERLSIPLFALLFRREVSIRFMTVDYSLMVSKHILDRNSKRMRCG